MAEEKFSFKISVSELREITNLLIDHLEEVEGEFVDLREDYYWNIPTEQKYNVLEIPTDLDIGQLTEDWQELRKLLGSEDRDIFLWHELAHLAPILRAIGEYTKG